MANHKTAVATVLISTNIADSLDYLEVLKTEKTVRPFAHVKSNLSLFMQLHILTRGNVRPTKLITIAVYHLPKWHCFSFQTLKKARTIHKQAYHLQSWSQLVL